MDPGTAFGWLTKRGDAVTRKWIRALPSLWLGDTTLPWFHRVVRPDSHALEAAAEKVARFTKPALVVWAAGKRIMRPEYCRRLATLIPNGTLIEIDDSYSLVPLDQLARLAAAVRSFTGAPG